MFDFLTPEKKNIILNHPELGKPYFAHPRQIDERLFIENLLAFQSTLCNPELPDRVRFNEIEIHRIILELQGIKQATPSNSNELKILAQRILNEAGFEVVVDGTVGVEHNDWLKPLSDKDAGPDLIEYCYIRAVHKLHDYNHVALWNYHHRKGAPPNVSNQTSAMPFKKIMPCIPNTKYQINVPIPRNSHIVPFNICFGMKYHVPNIEYTRPVMPYESCNEAFPTHSQLANYRTVYPNYISCWLLYSKIDVQKKQFHAGWQPRTVKTPRKYIGFLGFEKTEQVIEKTYGNFDIVKSFSYMPFNQIVDSNDNSPAYMLELVYQNSPKEYIGRGRLSTLPQIFLVCSKNLAETIIAYLLNHPDDYNALIREFIPASLFPGTNKLLDQKPLFKTKGVVLLNYAKGNSYLNGELVAVDVDKGIMEKIKKAIDSFEQTRPQLN